MYGSRKVLGFILTLILVLSSFSLVFGTESNENQTAIGDMVWEGITFGQSTDLNFSANVLPEKIGFNYADPEVPGTIEGAITMESRGGKLARGHDGLTFYYTKINANDYNFVLEADMLIEQFGPETGALPGTQDSAGIMVRDINGGARQDPMLLGFEEVPAASNIFAVGMMRHGISSISRTGVIYPWGNLGTEFDASKFEGATDEILTNTIIKARLERTDTEFIMTATYVDPDTNEEVTVEESVAGADYVQVLDETYMYVGFYASRNAKVIFDNASITLSEANTVPSEIVEPVEADPFVQIVSAPQAASNEYDFKVLTNYDGSVTIEKDNEEVLSDASITGKETLSYNAILENEVTDFTVFFTPTQGPSNDTIQTNIEVTKKIYNSGDGLFVSPEGTSGAEGTIEDPLDLETAIQHVLPGETIFMRGGTYTPSDILFIGKEYSGEEDNVKTIAPYEGEKVIIDGQGELDTTIIHRADYWHYVGLEVTGSANVGMRLQGDHNLIELMTFNFNGDTGFHLHGLGEDPDEWPKYNLILNCESHDNRDDRNIDADGFAAKLGVGVGNVFRGNIAHHNIDDGWDLYNRTNEGANMPVTLDGNIAYSNGKLSDGFNQDGSTGNGFKLGGEGLPVAHIVKNNIAFDNNMDGFTDNFNPGAMEISNNTSFDNKRFNYIFRLNPYFEPEEQGIFTNNISLRSNPDIGVADYISGNVDKSNYFFDGEKTVNNQGRVITVDEFINVIMPEMYERDDNGDIVWGDFLRLERNSFLNNVGENGTHVGALPFYR
ncbi:hypothetical protein EDC19_1953 [Natranaerovirga hydrolytica]|uniref:Parallel beta helix pectate lyase-like protein n=1 Tax=Natranaerovirga hydrolytica TaxID=680378 RepID=A0A4R1MJ57_9FIRM|nr:right-handed parallel beta-helix repeat-containing protein [Natranaerovirga hydrolytica]TCK92798.1 hypothetical protein EDC19_1953 [Natranaerovirga hydrolytica]